MQNIEYGFNLYVGWFTLPDATKRVADEYPEKAWMAFLSVSKEPARRQQDAVKVEN